MASSADALVISFGEMLIDFVPDTSGVSLAESHAFIKAPGGAPANVACAISKLGGNAAFIGKVGDDEFGRMLADILKKNGVNIDGVCFDMEARTALAFVTLRKDGEREFMFYRNPSADMLLKESELNMGLIKQSKIFRYGSISLISEPCGSAHLAAMKAAKEGGALLSYDPNVRLPLWPSHDAARSVIKSIWFDADYDKHERRYKYSGFCIEIFEKVLGLLEYDLPYEYYPINGTYPDLVQLVYNKTYDAVVGDMTILAERLQYVDFSVPYTESGLSMVVTERSQESAWMFMKPFTWQMWAVTGAILIYTMLVVWYLERDSNPEFEGNWKVQINTALWVLSRPKGGI